MSALQRSVGELRDNPAQWQAFTTEGHCAVMAPPGSGKTKLLATRAAHDLVNCIPRPHGAACITLTNPAAGQLRHRITDLGIEPRSTFFTGRVHGFALTRIILPFAHPAGLGEIAELKIASRAAKDKALHESVDEVFPRATRNAARLARSTVTRQRKLMASEHEWHLTGADIREAARRYERKLRGQGLLDRLVKALCFDYRFASELFAVGDPDQAVFGWTGTRPELPAELAASPGVTPVHLEINYRCGTEIIARAQRLLDGHRRVSGKGAGGCVEAHSSQPGSVPKRRQPPSSPEHSAPAAHHCTRSSSYVLPTRNARRRQQHSGQPAYPPSSVALLVEALAAWAVLGHEASGHRLGDLLRRWRDTLASRWNMAASGQLAGLLTAYRARGAEPASQFLADVLAVGLQDAIYIPGRSDEANAVADMAAALTVGGLASCSVIDLAERARNIDRIEVTTTSSGKGLEFDIVLLLGAEEGKMPHFGSIGDQEKLDEDRRKFYVSVTRARKEVHIFYSGFDDRYGKMRRNGPSRFSSSSAC